METYIAPALPTDVLSSAVTKRLTAEEFRALEFEDESFFYELLYGELVRRSALPRLRISALLKISFLLLTLLL